MRYARAEGGFDGSVPASGRRRDVACGSLVKRSLRVEKLSQLRILILVAMFGSPVLAGQPSGSTSMSARRASLASRGSKSGHRPCRGQPWIKSSPRALGSLPWMPFPARSYVGYIDDSGNESVGWIWTALVVPMDLWSEYLHRWLQFRRWLYKKHRVPANFELHAQAWLSVEPAKQTRDPDQLALVEQEGELLEVLRRGRAQRRARFEAFEKGLKTIGTFTESQLFTASSYPRATGAAKIDLYDELLCMMEGCLARTGTRLTVLVDGAHDSGGHLKSAHRALLVHDRRVVEDAGLRRSSESQLLQMADCCAHAAFQSVQDKPNLDEGFRRLYETVLSRLIYQPFQGSRSRLIRGLDYPHACEGCSSERHRA
jgi:hypothetical protein